MRVETTRQFDKWLSKLKDNKARIAIAFRFKTMQHDQTISGDWKVVGNDILKLRFHIGPGYRIYAAQEGELFLLLLIGGDKSSQKRDIKQAKRILKDWRRSHAR